MAGCAVVTLPLGVLQAPPGATGSVRFEPDLVEKRAAWGRLPVQRYTGGKVRVWAAWQDPKDGVEVW